MTERSGTDEQIWVRLKRGDTVTSIRNELGCGQARIAAMTKAMGLVRKAGQPPRPPKGTRKLKTTQFSSTCTPWVRIGVPVGWDFVEVVVSDDSQTITITQAKR